MVRHRIRLFRIGILVFALAALLIPSFDAALAKPLALQTDGTDSAASGVDGNSYTSPTYGYSLTWDRTWSVTDEQSDGDTDELALSNDVATVYVTGVADPSSPEACLNTVAGNIGDEDGVSNVVEDRNADDPIGADVPGRAWAVYNLTYTSDKGDSVDMTEYIDCRTVVPKQSVVVIQVFTVADDYDSQVKSIGELLQGFATDGSTGSDTGDTGGDVGEPGSNADTQQITQFVETSVRDIDEFWTREFPLISGGRAYTPPADVLTFDDKIDTDGCGSADVGEGPFYCPADQKVYYDIEYAQGQIENLGPSAIAVAAAHEVGHHVQNLMAWKECEQTPCLDPTEMTSQEFELQSDCFAGAWTADAETRGRLGSFDVEANIVQFAVFLGDPSGNVADAGAHGKAARRVYSFLTGYYSGVTECLKISAASDPARNGGANATTNATAGEPAATPDDAGTTNEPTPTAEDTGTATANAGDLIQMGDQYAIELANATLTMTVTSTETTPELDVRGGIQADGRYVIVYFSLDREAQAPGPFTYDSFILTDGDGNEYTYDEAATDAFLKTSDTLPDGVDQAIDADSTYNLAIVFDVPEDASDFVFSTSSGDFPVQLDI